MILSLSYLECYETQLQPLPPNAFLQRCSGATPPSVCWFMAISHKNLKWRTRCSNFPPHPFIILLCFSSNTILEDGWEKSQRRTLIWDSTMQRKPFFLGNVGLYQCMQSFRFPRSWGNHILHTLKCFRFASAAFALARTVLPVPFNVILKKKKDEIFKTNHLWLATCFVLWMLYFPFHAFE